MRGGASFNALGVGVIMYVALACGAAMLAWGALTGLAAALPVTVKVAATHASRSSRSGVADDWPDDAPEPPEPPGARLVPGGSQIGRSIDDGVARMRRYNDALQRAAAKTFGAPMLEARVTRDALVGAHDEWSAGDAPAAAGRCGGAPAHMTKEITLFNF